MFLSLGTLNRWENLAGFLPNLIELAIPGFVLLRTLEAIADAVMRRDLYEIKDSAASITIGPGNVAMNLLSPKFSLDRLALLP